MLQGFNHNIRYHGRLFHVQTEDGGLQNPHIVTLLYHGGSIVSSKKTAYADILTSDRRDQVVSEIMREQHRQMLRDLREGRFDAVLAPLGLGPVGEAAGADAPRPPVGPKPAGPPDAGDPAQDTPLGPPREGHPAEAEPPRAPSAATPGSLRLPGGPGRGRAPGPVSSAGAPSGLRGGPGQAADDDPRLDDVLLDHLASRVGEAKPKKKR